MSDVKGDRRGSGTDVRRPPYSGRARPVLRSEETTRRLTSRGVVDRFWKDPDSTSGSEKDEERKCSQSGLRVRVPRGGDEVERGKKGNIRKGGRECST